MTGRALTVSAVTGGMTTGRSPTGGAGVRNRHPVPFDAGSAMIEFTFLAVLLMVPLVYVVISVFSVQRAAFGVTEATKQAGRAFVTAESDDQGRARAQLAAASAMRDQGLALPPGSLSISCDADDCLTPGAVVRVAIDYDVDLPFLPRVFGGPGTPAVAVHGRHAEIVDEFRVRR